MRRTVRVAIALATGQALLCGVIGWVTFGPPETGPRAAAPVEPLIRHSPVVPAVSLPPTVRTSTTAGPDPVATSRTPRARASSTRPPKPLAAPPAGTTTATTPPTTPAAPADDPPADPVIAPPEPAPEPTLTSTRPGLVGPSVPDETVQGPVEVGDRCKPAGARGLTADDRRVRCVRDDDGDLRWQIN